jgi:hypothetical protein
LQRGHGASDVPAVVVGAVELTFDEPVFYFTRSEAVSDGVVGGRDPEQVIIAHAQLREW